MEKVYRSVDDKTILDKFAEEFCRVVDRYVSYIVCSGFVAIAHGRARGTEDIDMLVEKISKNKFIELHKELVKKGFECVQSDDAEVIYDDYLSNRVSVRYVMKDKNLFPPEMEIKFPKDKLDEEQIKDRTKLPLTGLDIYFSSIESNIAFKEEFLKSQKDLEDARHLRIIYEGKLDMGKIKRIKEKIKKFRFYK